MQGIETDGKNYKHIRRDDITWICEDLNVIRKATEKYIENIRPSDETEMGTSEKNNTKKLMTVDRIIALVFFGFSGPLR